MLSLFWLIFIYGLNMLLKLTTQQTLDALNYDIYGERLAMNQYFGILADNDLEQFLIFYPPYSSNLCLQLLDYVYSDQYVYSVAIGSQQNSSQYSFAYIGEYENGTSSTIQTFFGFQTVGYCNISQGQSLIINLDQNYQRNSIIGIDSYGTMIFVVSSTSVFSYNINKQITNQWIIDYNYLWQYSPRSIVVDDNQIAHIVGYLCLAEIYCQYTFLKLSIDSTFSSLQNRTQTIGNDELQSGRLFQSNDPITDMSLAINTYLKLLLIGIPYENTIYIYNYSTNDTYGYVSNFTYNQAGTGFGKSVAWLDNETIAILAYSLSTFPWSTSQIQVYSLDDILHSDISYPFSAYPNNQQNYDIDKKFLIKTFLMMISWSSNNLAILSDHGDVYLIPQNSPGYSSSKLTNNYYPLRINIYLEETCIVGTYKNDSKFGPCFVCPSKTNNNGSSSIQCSICLNNSFCPLAAVNDINNDELIDFDQSYSYPESPKLIDFEDILINRVFSFGSTTKCLLMSPLFWACVVLGIAMFIIILMGVLHLCPKQNLIREKMKTTFSHFDLIGEGELWIGGLFSLVLCVLIIFSYIFSANFIKLYPIENVNFNAVSFSCDSSMTNSKFSSSVELLAIRKSNDEKEIFDMLDSQPLNLTIQLINTGFNCSNLKLQQNTGSSTPSISLTSFNCSKQSTNSILVVSTILSNHEMIIQYNLTGPYFIGGLRICFTSDYSIYRNYKLQSLEFCQFFSTENQTLSNSPYINVEITKIINRTISLYSNDVDQYAGRWLPSLTIYPLSNSLLYQQTGDFIRYLNYQSILIVNIQESSFYVQNIQEPIIDPDALIFQSILFTLLCIELFALFFLTMKLTVVPIIRLIQRKLLHRVVKLQNTVRNMDEDSESETTVHTIDREINKRNSRQRHA